MFFSTLDVPFPASSQWHSGAWCGASRGHTDGETHATGPLIRACPSHGASSRRPCASGRADGAGGFLHSGDTMRGRPVARSSTSRRCSCAASRGMGWRRDRQGLLSYNPYLFDDLSGVRVTYHLTCSLCLQRTSICFMLQI